jgi:hypothetical protein
VGGNVENPMKKYLTAAAILALSGGVAVAHQTSSANGSPSTSRGIGADVRAKAHAQHDSANKGIGAEVSAEARSQRPEATPTPTPTPSPSPTPTSTAPVGPSTQ